MDKSVALATLLGRVPTLEPGHVWLAGAGPGDPGLLTLDAFAALSAASIPATMRGVNHAIIFATGHADADFDWAALAKTGQPIVIYMAMRNIEHIVNELKRGGLASNTAAAVIVSATTSEQRVL